MVISSLAYDLSRHLGSGVLRKVILYPSVILMFLSIWLGPLFVVPFAFKRGAAPMERYLASLVTPALWVIKTIWSFVGIYSLLEVLFLLVHPFIMGNIGVNILSVGLAELACRIRHRGDEGVKVFSPATGIFLVAGLVITFAGLWNGGHSYYYVFMDLYTLLFL
jgi:hypothetical protein